MKPFEKFEQYVRQLCTDALSHTELSVIVPPLFNTTDQIFAGHSRSIRPDIKICNKNNGAVAIVDAKNRNYQYLTNVSGNLTLDAESLFRMHFYLNYYRILGSIIHGVFVVPNTSGVPLFEQATISYDPSLIVTLLGIDIHPALAGGDFSNNLKEHESRFTAMLRGVLGH